MGSIYGEGSSDFASRCWGERSQYIPIDGYPESVIDIKSLGKQGDIWLTDTAGMRSL